MPEITREEVAHLARLSRLALDDAELDALASQLDVILGAVAQIREVADVEGVRPTTHAAVGADTVAALGDVRADVAFVATNGISIGYGLTTPDRDEAAVKRAIIESARRTIVLADSTKIGVETAVRFAALADIDTLVTDGDIDRTDRRDLQKAGLEVVVA